MRRWETLLGAEAKSRIYLALLGREEGLNVFKLADIFRGEGKKEYTRSYIEVTLKEMAKNDETLQPRAIQEGGKRPVIKYRSDPDVYLEFLKDCLRMGKKDLGKSMLGEIKKVILGLFPIFNELAVLNVPEVDALGDISLCCSYINFLGSGIEINREYFIRECDRMTERGLTGPIQKMAYDDFLRPAIWVILDRVYSFPRIKLDKKIIETSEKYFIVFQKALWVYGAIVQAKMRNKSWSFDKCLEEFEAFKKKQRR